MTRTTQKNGATHLRCSSPYREECFTSWTVTTHSYVDEECTTLSEITTLDLLVQDLSEWFGLTQRQCEELFDLGMINFIPDTNGECFGFYVNTEDMTPLKQEILPQVNHILEGNNNSYMYSVRHLLEYDQLWDMLGLECNDDGEPLGEELSWHKDIKQEFELATILWRFNELNKNYTTLAIDDITSLKKIHLASHLCDQYLLEVDRSSYPLINNKFPDQPKPLSELFN